MNYCPPAAAVHQTVHHNLSTVCPVSTWLSAAAFSADHTLAFTGCTMNENLSIQINENLLGNESKSISIN